MKKILHLLVLAAIAIVANAQTEGWYKYPVYSDSITDVIETTGKVYYLSGTNLFSFDPADDEAYAYSSLNRLTGSAVSAMHYDYDRKYLLVIYEDCNMDVFYDNGRMVNLPEVRDAQINGTKKINHVAFGRDRMVLSTSFGLVVYNADKMEVVESGIYGLNVFASAIVGDNLVICYKDGSNTHLGHSPLSERHNSIERFAHLGNMYFRDMVPVSDNAFVAIGGSSGKIQGRIIDFENNTVQNTPTYDYVMSQNYRKCADGYYSYSLDALYVVKDGNNVARTELPAQLQGNKISLLDDASKVWGGAPNGLARFDISSSTPTVLYDRMLYPNAMTCGKVGYLKWSPDGSRLYVSNMESSGLRSYALDECRNAYQTTNILEDGHARDVSLKVATADHTKSIGWQQLNGNKRMYGDPAWIVQDPDDPDKYYCANNHEGLYVIKLNPQTGEYEEIGKFNCDNSPVPDHWGARVQDVNIDPQGNLWIGYQHGAHYAILPAAKRRQDPKTLQASDWREHSKLENSNFDQKDMMSLFCQKSNMLFIISGKYKSGLTAIDTKGTYDNPNDDVVYTWTQFTDQDGNNFAAAAGTLFLLEDRRGALWVGTTQGLFEITNPANATNPSMTVRKIKVPRNDGTNYADYLLDSDQINWMALDPSNRKWIATDNSGLFLVSEAGDKILKNYTVDNSPLPYNCVTAVECDRHDNTVYVGTTVGLFTMLGDSSPAHDDYSDIYAYPNPVRPEFTGDVTITGLMENSIVKIADASGNVVYQTRSEGGMAVWGACTQGGERVKSGVYYVYASNSNNDQSAGAVTKILVIN